MKISFIADVERVPDFIGTSRGAKKGAIPCSLLRKKWAELTPRSIPFILLILAVFIFSGCRATITVNQNLGPDVSSNQVEIDKQNNEKSQEINSDNAATITSPIVLPSPEKKPEDVVSQKLQPETPSSLDYPVAFAPQAPYAVWDELHEEACEEAAIIIVAKYFKNEPLSAHDMEQAILNLVEWEKQNGYQVDLTAEEAKDVLIKYFGLNARTVTEVTIDRIKKELAAKNLIIVPAAGRKLGNPYFQTPGPIYHMLVIRGYDQDEFITDDPGTRRGEGYRYRYQALLNAVHDWDHKLAEGGMTDEEMERGRKVMVVISK